VWEVGRGGGDGGGGVLDAVLWAFVGWIVDGCLPIRCYFLCVLMERERLRSGVGGGLRVTIVLCWFSRSALAGYESIRRVSLKEGQRLLCIES